MEKLKSSFRNLQGALTRITPTAAPSCIQQSKSQSLTQEAAEEYSRPRQEGEFDYLQQPHRISSKRFFFSPRATKSIMEEKEKEAAAAAEEEEEACLWEESSCAMSILSEEEACLWEESSCAMSILSEDPLGDFRASMEEMVAGLQLTEWRSLEQLLCCYLRLNERSSHDAIVLAFVDLLMQQLSQS